MNWSGPDRKTDRYCDKRKRCEHHQWRSTESISGLRITFGFGFGASQNAPVQIFVIENSVKSPTARATATMAEEPWLRPASTRANFARKPENGGNPARLRAGTANSAAITGALRTNPPTELEATSLLGDRQDRRRGRGRSSRRCGESRRTPLRQRRPR